MRSSLRASAFLTLIGLVFSALILVGCQKESEDAPTILIRSVSSQDVQHLTAIQGTGDILKKITLTRDERGPMVLDTVDKSVLVASSNRFTKFDLKSLKRRDIIPFGATLDLQGAESCGGRIFVISSSDVRSYSSGLNGKVQRVKLAKSVHKSPLTGIACSNRQKQLILAFGEPGRGIISIDTKSGKVQNTITERSKTGLLSSSSQSGPLISADPGRAIVFIDVAARDNARRNLIYRYNLLRGELEKDIVLNTKSELLFQPVWLERGLLMLIAGNAPFTLYDASKIDIELAEEEGENHATFIDPLTFELKKVVQLPNGQMSYPAYNALSKTVFFGIDDQVFSFDLATGKLRNFTEVEGEQILQILVISS